MKQYKCPECGAECTQEKIDVTEAILLGLWSCQECGWVQPEPPEDTPIEYIPRIYATEEAERSANKALETMTGGSAG